MSGPGAMRFRGTLAARVSLLTTVAVGLSVALMAAAAYATVRHQLFAALDQSLLGRATSAASTPALGTLTRNDVPSWVLGAADVRIGVLDADGQVVDTESVGPPIELGAAELAVARGEHSRSLRSVASGGSHYRVCAVPGNDAGTALVLAQSLTPVNAALSRLGVVLAVFGLLGVVAAGLAGWAVARNGLRPVRQLTAEVEEIGRTEDLHPITVRGNDEIARLAAAFNAMLGSLAGSRDRQRQLVADAGHELRTPLTSMRTNIDLLAQADARGGLAESARTELMADVRFQIDELTTLIGDLTELAREDSRPAQPEPVDLAEVVSHALDRVRRRAAEPGVVFDVVLDPWPVIGEVSSLERAVTNLLDNAVKWSPAGGVVTVRLTEGTLYVGDQGPGIAPEDLPHVFERFYRSAESRTMPGSGLGLAIVRTITERHGGTVVAGRAPEGGAAFWLRLPPDAPADLEPTRRSGTPEPSRVGARAH
ncbi:MAG: Two component system sensor histidine kinase MprB [uncultured Nocardioidaceae bacterium]|uniref:histidine kinase n=1 Tax=uncultured Nocardioidaceae bacterium TaxID=253824 RepID=A0A6J4MIK6_9ACTN|nr:MAG: Two component system sensor histidine kinase MprB [uncultured Nocardioidaceae bacterium]